MFVKSQPRQTNKPLPLLGGRYHFGGFVAEVVAVAWDEDAEMSFVTYFWCSNPEPRPCYRMDASAFNAQFSGQFVTRKTVLEVAA